MQFKKGKEDGCCEPGCCFGADVRHDTVADSTVSNSAKAFGDLIASVSASGKVDKRVKELIVFSLAVFQRCEACVNLHYDKALGMGISKEELDEAAWCAVLLGGAPVKMFYKVFVDRKDNGTKSPCC